MLTVTINIHRLNEEPEDEDDSDALFDRYTVTDNGGLYDDIAHINEQEATADAEDRYKEYDKLGYLVNNVTRS